MENRHTYMIAWLALLVAGGVHASGENGEPVTAPALTLHGFGSLGLARADDGDAQFIRDLSQPYGVSSKWSAKLDSVFGIQAGYRFNDRFEAGLQAISRYHTEGNFSPEISWAFLRYNPDPTTSLRFGRLGTEFFMLADSRLVGFSNLTVRPPPDYYGPLVLSYFDGVDAAKAVPLGPGLLRGKLFAGRSPEKMYLSDGLYWDLSGTLLVGGHLDYLTGPWQIRLGQTRVRFDKDLPVNQFTGLDILGNVPAMRTADRWTRYDSLGVVYDRGPLQVQAMLSRIEQGSAAFEDSRSGYVIASYRTGSVTPYVGYSRVKSDPVHITTAAPFPYNVVAANLSQATHADQHTWTLGARWDVRNDLALKVQVDRIDGKPGSVFPFREETAAWDGDMTVFSLALDFVF